MVKNRAALAENVGASFDLLRARIEDQFGSPAVIGVASSGISETREVAARCLAMSIANAGYATLLVDTVSDGLVLETHDDANCLESSVERHLRNVDAPSGLSTMMLSDPSVHRKTSLRSVRSAFDALSKAYDYVVVVAESRTSASFAAAIVSNADAVIVAAQPGQRARRGDVRFAEMLRTAGDRFVGVVSMDAASTRDLFARDLAVSADQRPAKTGSERHYGRFDVVEPSKLVI